jgi:hypothetical protein
MYHDRMEAHDFSGSPAAAIASDRFSSYETDAERVDQSAEQGIVQGVATLLQVYRLRSFMKTCRAGRQRAPPW